jgi:2-hydroxy-3-oxopropionate reductase
MEKVGFIGLGLMGKPMALNLVKAGYSLTVHSRSQGPVDELVAAGAGAATTPREVAEKSDIVITILPDSPDVEKVVLGENGLKEGFSDGDLFIDMSTIEPKVALDIHAALAEIGVDAIDAPVSGGDIGARQGILSIMVGASESAFKRATPLFEVMGKNIVRIGEAGAGQTTKACNQIMVAQTIQGVAEAMTLARKCGIDLVKVRNALLGGFAQSRILEVHGQKIIDRNFEPGFKTELHRKDLNIVLQTARALGVSLPGTALVAENMNALIAQGHGKKDNSALALLCEQMANV